MRFSYYAGLSAKQRRTYRKSDEVKEIRLAHSEALASAVAALRAALAAERRVAVEKAASALCHCITRTLQVPPVSVRVLSKRPKNHEGELHGLYTWEEGKRAQIEVWMRTAERRDVVAFRTFLRTLMHEVCHHLDFMLLGLEDTFHTEGFFRRESSLVRILAPATRAPRRPARFGDAPGAKASKSRKIQLTLFE